MVIAVTLPRFPLCAAVCAAAGLLVASCTTLPPVERTRANALAARIDAVLARRGLGPDALSVIDNIIRHDTAPPPFAASPIVSELLSRPTAAADAAALFQLAVSEALRRLAEEAFAAPQASGALEKMPVSLRALLDAYLGELADAQRVLRSATRGAPIATQAILRELGQEQPSSGRLREVAAGFDQAALDRATTMFLNATTRFVRALRAAEGLQFPDAPARFDSAVGIVSIGTRGDDVHGPDAAVIVDPGGNDTYERAPAIGGAISVIVDLGGNDRYRGSDLVVHGLSAIVDFSGNDRYTMAGPGLGAAIAGASVLVDFAGDDTYEADLFGQGAAAFGLGAIIDLRGNDTYCLRAFGQGLGLAGGTGLLWDRGGNDTYTAAGLPDVYGRGGGVSFAQGTAHGFRTMLGGGIGILRDDAGNDIYQAQLFAQGVGYYYGVGLLWDGGGDDRYRAARYAQGSGVHEAAGVLRDESGNDRYELGVGVGQGMGLDLAVGMLFDGAGDDRYEAPVLAQGTGTANGIGIVIDGGGADQWHMGTDQRSWGRAEWLRGLSTLGVLLYDPARAVFTREGKPVSPPPRSAELGGPLGDAAIAYEPAGKPACPTAAPAIASSALPLAAALLRIGLGFAGGAAEPAIYADVQRRLTTRLEASIAELPTDDFDILYSFGRALHCALAGALRERPAPAPQMQRILRVLDEHPRCGVRTGALSLRNAIAADDASRASVATLARSALRSSCWRLQAQALTVLRRMGVEPDTGADLPSFLRTEPFFQ